MGNTPIVYQYENNDVSFLFKNGNQMINATEMTRIFNKNIGDYLRQKSTKEYIIEISNDMGIPISEVYQVVKGGNPKIQGTWMLEDLALDYAHWLSPKFKLWCNRKIKELLRNGYVYLKTTSRNELEDHVKYQVQRENSKAIAMKNYGIEKNQQKIINHYRDITLKLVGIYPNQIKSWGRENGVPDSVINKGGREVLRYISSTATACMSLIENIISSNPEMTTDNVDELLPYVIQLEPFFKKMIEIGHHDTDELRKIREYENIKKSLNEK